MSKIRKGWDGKSIWHSGSNPKNSGVAILFSKSLNIEILKTEKHLDGKLIKCLAQIENQIFQLINVMHLQIQKKELIISKNYRK